MNNRTAVLKSLLNLDKPIGEITTALSEFDWDSDELVVIEIHHIGQILERYLSGEFDESVVEAWADAIECRDDIGISQEGKDDIEKLIYELANPDLAQRLTPERAENLVYRLSRRSVRTSIKNLGKPETPAVASGPPVHLDAVHVTHRILRGP